MNGNSEIKSHPWFNNFSWQALTDKKIITTYFPASSEDNFDQKHVNNNDWKDAEQVAENSLLLRRNSVQALFKGYLYDKASLIHRSTTAHTGKYSPLAMESMGKSELDHDSGLNSTKKYSELVTRLGGGEDFGEENVIEEED